MLRRAVFSDVQRKALEKMFQKQKYISKPDRKKLAAKLGLKDSQVRRGTRWGGQWGVGSQAPHPQRQLEGRGRTRGQEAGRTAHGQEKVLSKLQGYEHQGSQESDRIPSWVSRTGQTMTLSPPDPSLRVPKGLWSLLASVQA